VNDERRFTQALRSAAPPVSSSEALERTVLAARAAVARSGKRRRSLAWRLGIAFAVIAAIAGLSVTPPGRAIAEEIADLFGIGESPSGSAGFGKPAVVIGLGDSPEGYPFEVIAAVPKGGARGEEVCIGLDLPGLGGGRAASCLSEAEGDLARLDRAVLLPTVYAAPRELGARGELIVQGLARPDVETIEVAYVRADGVTERAPVQIATLDRELGGRVGAEASVRFFAAFIPTGVLRGKPGDPRFLTEDSVASSLERVRVIARDEEGGLLTEGTPAELNRTLQIPNASPLLVEPPAGFETVEDHLRVAP
jgi:hypothetical protein